VGAKGVVVEKNQKQSATKTVANISTRYDICFLDKARHLLKNKKEK
jgi:hypothetical protein